MNKQPLESSTFTIYTLALLCLVLIVAAMPFPTAYAQETSLSLSPSILQIRAKPPTSVEAPFTIENRSKEAMHLIIGYKVLNKAQSQEGIATYLNESEETSKVSREIFSNIQIVDNDNTSIDTIELGPKQQKKLTMRVNLPKDTKLTDYYFSLILITDSTPRTSTESYINKKDQKSVSTLQAGIGMHVFLAIGNDFDNQSTVDTFTTPFISQSTTIPFTLRLRNDSQHFIAPKGTITIDNMFGQKVDTINLPETIILSGTSRSLTNDKTASNNLTSPKILWKSNYPIGLYQATLKLDPQKPASSQHVIRFFVLPLQFIGLLLLLILGILVMILMKTKHKTKH